MHGYNELFSFSSGHIEVVKLLASHGAEVACKDKKSYTPLHAAASSGMISVVKYLLDLGVDVSSTHIPLIITPRTRISFLLKSSSLFPSVAMLFVLYKLAFM